MKSIAFKKLIAAKALAALKYATAASMVPQQIPVPVRVSASLTPRLRSAYPK